MNDNTKLKLEVETVMEEACLSCKKTETGFEEETITCKECVFYSFESIADALKEL